MNSGMNDRIGTVDSRPIRSAPQPHWNTITRTPYAAPTLSRFMTAALSGTSSERNTTSSSRNDSSTTAAMNHRQPLLHAVAEVGEDRHLAADVGSGGAAVECLREDVGPEPVDGLPGGLGLRGGRRLGDQDGDPGGVVDAGG